jgi:hypothetical protein
MLNYLGAQLMAKPAGDLRSSPDRGVGGLRRPTAPIPDIAALQFDNRRIAELHKPVGSCVGRAMRERANRHMMIEQEEQFGRLASVVPTERRRKSCWNVWNSRKS